MPHTAGHTEMFMPQSASPVSTALDIGLPQEGDAFGGLSALISLNKFLKKSGITLENQPKAHEQIMSMWGEGGKPYIDAGSAKSSRTNLMDEVLGINVGGRYVEPFLPWSEDPDTIKTYGKYDTVALLEELSHGYQLEGKSALQRFSTGAKSVYDMIGSKVKRIFDPNAPDQYGTPGTIEYEAHSEIAPLLRERYTTALKEDWMDLTNGGEPGPDWNQEDAIKYMNRLIEYNKETEDLKSGMGEYAF